jgi:hypothetical protein
VAIVDDVPTAVNDAATQASENAAVTVNVSPTTPPVRTASSSTPSPRFPARSPAQARSPTTTTAASPTPPRPGEQGTVRFDYTITDGDGDVSRATVTITLLADSTPTVSVAGDNTVDEAALPARPGEPAGSNAASPDETAAGTIGVTTGGDTLASLVINGVNVTTGGTVTSAKGVLTVTLAMARTPTAIR